MNIKKILPVIILLTLLAGCAKDTEAPGEMTESKQAQESEPESEEADTDKLTCGEITDYVLNSGIDFPANMRVTDEKMLSDVMGYDMSIAADYCSAVQLISADLFELTVILPAEGQSEAVDEMLEKRRDYLINSAAFYPPQVKAAEASVTGGAGDYRYLICFSDEESTAAAEEKLLQCIDGR